jgi:Rne/Rng family ribonuclease
MPTRELLIGADAGEWRAALCEDGVAVELYLERGAGDEIGSIHLGRVTRRLPALAAVLVDIGGARPVFLPERDASRGGVRLAEGERVVVQIRREAQGGKSARGSARPVLRGHSIELAPDHQGGEGLDPADDARLRMALDRARTDAGAGLRIIRPAPVDALLADAAAVARRWATIRDRAGRLDPPARLDPAATFAAALAGAMPVLPERVAVDDPAAVPEIGAAFADAAVRCAAQDVSAVDLDALIDEALAPEIALGGGAVHIEAARTAVLIDVDTGSAASGAPQEASPERAGLMTDLAAAPVIARQLRLRSLGGGIVVDFVGLDRPRSRAAVVRALAEALLPDPARPQILGWTRLGHLELVRPRHRRPLAEALGERSAEGALVKSAATIAFAALRAVRRAARAEPGRRQALVVAPEIAAVLAGPAAAARRALETRLGREIPVTPEADWRRDRFEIVAR